MVFKEGCGESDIAHLVLCNKLLYQKLESVLYSGPDAQSKAMKWACLDGNVNTIKKSIWYGASVHSSTYLCLASTKQQENAIRLLVDLGVRILSPDMDKKNRFKGIEEFRYCAKKLCSSRLSHEQSSSLLRLLYEKAIDEQGRKKWDADTALPLITLIRSPAGAPMDLIRQVLDDGADPNQPRPFKRRDSLSPLSAAIIANSEPAFHLLLERGANIHGTPMKNWARVGLSLPIFAAAMTLAVADHGKAMMQLCLDNGADINYEQICPDYGNSRFRGWHPGRTQRSQLEIYTHTTPLLIFLDSIKSFKSPKLPNPVEGLNWFFEHATRWEAPTVSTFVSQGHGTALSAADALIGKWGLAKFREAGFTEVIRILLRHQVVDRDPLSMYLRNWVYSYQNHWFRKIVKEEESKEGLGTLTTVLAENLQFNLRFLLPFEDIDDVLANFIREKPKEKVAQAENFDYIIIEKLLEAGANINATNTIYDGERDRLFVLDIDATKTIYNRDRYELSALHFWCSELNDLFKDFTSLDDHGKLWFRQAWIYTDWIPQLIRYGADPTMPAGDDGKTALDLLVADDTPSCSPRQSMLSREAIKKHLEDFASLWRKIHEDRLACGKKPVIHLTQGEALT